MTTELLAVVGLVLLGLSLPVMGAWCAQTFALKRELAETERRLTEVENRTARDLTEVGNRAWQQTRDLETRLTERIEKLDTKIDALGREMARSFAAVERALGKLEERQK